MTVVSKHSLSHPSLNYSKQTGYQQQLQPISMGICRSGVNTANSI